MSFITYLIIVGFYYGQKMEFTTEKQNLLISKLLFYWAFESIIQKAFFACSGFGSNVSVPFLDLVALAGYKYVPLCFITLF